MSGKDTRHGAAGPSHPPIQSVVEAIDALRAGELVVYPTETFYGIGADPFSAAALAKLFAVKGRDHGKPVALIAADAKSALALALEVSSTAARLADMFWPGPLTILLPARADLPPDVVGEDGAVGVRVSPHPIARALAEGLGHPITATSANLAGAAPARTLAEARATFGEKVKVYLEGGLLDAAAPSTIVSVKGDEWKIIRMGAITEHQLIAALSGEVLE